MQTARFEVPSLYGDHHVTEVRRVLLELPGVIDVYASSAFQIVEVSYDPAVLNDLQISVKLDEAGYLGEWTMPIELGIASEPARSEHAAFARHTIAYEATPKTVTFAQRVSYGGRPLWPCPGMDPMRSSDEEAKHAEKTHAQ
jgi:copper chaperone CopZ